MDETRDFVAACQIPWPCGYGIGSKVEALRGVVPAVVLVGRDGRVVWRDADARRRHETSHLAADLVRALEGALRDAEAN